MGSELSPYWPVRALKIESYTRLGSRYYSLDTTLRVVLYSDYNTKPVGMPLPGEHLKGVLKWKPRQSTLQTCSVPSQKNSGQWPLQNGH